MQHDERLLTEGAVAHMLGIRRAGGTVAAGKCQQADIIRDRRGRIHILDRKRSHNLRVLPGHQISARSPTEQ